MEKTISAEERIRRAEEIYQRRKVQSDVRVPTSNVNTKKNIDYRMFKKIILQIIICLLIYFIFYLIKNSNYIFSEDVISKTRQFLSYDINFQELYYQAQDYYNNNIKTILENVDKNEIKNQILKIEHAKRRFIEETFKSNISPEFNNKVINLKKEELNLI